MKRPYVSPRLQSVDPNDPRAKLLRKELGMRRRLVAWGRRLLHHMPGFWVTFALVLLMAALFGLLAKR